MANVKRFTNEGFRAAQDTTQAPEFMSSDSLRALGADMIKMGVKERLQEAEAKGIKEQLGSDKLLQKELGLLFRESDQAYNENARTTFNTKVNDELKDSAYTAYQKNRDNPDAFAKDFQATIDAKLKTVHTLDYNAVRASADGIKNSYQKTAQEALYQGEVTKQSNDVENSIRDLALTSFNNNRESPSKFSSVYRSAVKGVIASSSNLSQQQQAQLLDYSERVHDQYSKSAGDAQYTASNNAIELGIMSQITEEAIIADADYRGNPEGFQTYLEGKASNILLKQGKGLPEDTRNRINQQVMNLRNAGVRKLQNEVVNANEASMVMNYKKHIEEVITTLSREFEFDPKGFAEALENKREELLLPVDELNRPNVESYYNQRAATAERAVYSAKRQIDFQSTVTNFSDEHDRLKSSAMELMNQDGNVPDELLAQVEVMYEKAKSSGITGTKVQAWKLDFRDAVKESEIFYEFRKSTDKQEFINNLSDPDNELLKDKDGHVLYENAEVQTIQARLGKEISDQNAQLTALASHSSSEVRQVIDLMKNGKRHADEGRIIQSALQLAPSSTSLQIALKEYVALEPKRNVIELAYNVNSDQLQTLINQQRINSPNNATTQADEILITHLEKIQTDRAKAQKAGTGLDHAVQTLGLQIEHSQQGALTDPRARRTTVTQVRSRWGDQGVSYFTNEEQEAYKDRFSNGTAQERIKIIEDIGNSLMNKGHPTSPELDREELSRVIQEIQPDQPSLGVVASMYLGGDHKAKSLAKDVLRGLELVDQYKGGKMELEAQLKGTITQQLSAIFPDNGLAGGRRISQFHDVVMALAYREAVGQVTDSKSLNPTIIVSEMNVKNAIKKMLFIPRGKEIPRINNHPVMPHRPGVSNHDMENVWKNITEEDLMLFGEGAMPVDANIPNAKSFNNSVSLERIIENGFLIPEGKGVYSVAMPDRDQPNKHIKLRTQTNSLYLLDFNQLEQRHIHRGRNQ